MTPDEVLRLAPPQKLGEGSAERITGPGQSLIFVSGSYPILGTQMLYFLDPELNRRAKRPPPKHSLAIEGGSIRRQRHIDRTPHIVSRPEDMDDEALSIAEMTLLEEMERTEGE